MFSINNTLTMLNLFSVVFCVVNADSDLINNIFQLVNKETLLATQDALTHSRLLNNEL
jgi:hypothetical protein